MNVVLRKIIYNKFKLATKLQLYTFENRKTEQHSCEVSVFRNLCVSGTGELRGVRRTSQFKCALLAKTPLRLVKPQNYFIILIVAFYKKVFHTKNKTYISTETYVLFPYILIIIRFLFFLPSCICLQFCRTEYL